MTLPAFVPVGAIVVEHDRHYEPFGCGCSGCLLALAHLFLPEARLPQRREAGGRISWLSLSPRKFVTVAYFPDGRTEVVADLDLSTCDRVQVRKRDPEWGTLFVLSSDPNKGPITIVEGGTATLESATRRLLEEAGFADAGTVLGYDPSAPYGRCKLCPNSLSRHCDKRRLCSDCERLHGHRFCFHCGDELKDGLCEYCEERAAMRRLGATPD